MKGAQTFVQTPTSQTVSENTDVVLECVVENPIGDCLWLKDGRNIGYNLDRYPHYTWRGDRLTGDCSLVISAAQAARDCGEWVCEVTGDQENPTLTSTPVKLLISGDFFFFVYKIVRSVTGKMLLICNSTDATELNVNGVFLGQNIYL